MKKIFILIAALTIISSCQKEEDIEILETTAPIARVEQTTTIVQTPPPTPPSTYLFDGTINGYVFQTDYVTVTELGGGRKMFSFGENPTPKIMIIIDTLYQGLYINNEGFTNCVSLDSSPSGGVISWCNSFDPLTNYIGELNIIDLNDSIITGNLNVELFNQYFKDINGNDKDSLIVISGVITGLDLKM